MKSIHELRTERFEAADPNLRLAISGLFSWGEGRRLAKRRFTELTGLKLDDPSTTEVIAQAYSMPPINKQAGEI